ncbi:MAG: YIP1 family protein [Ruminococcus flavefaciens]|nr:YIP1 family protein [Ruminococcus flavefaciens]
MKNLTEWQWLKYTVTHISEGFEDMRWKKSGSLKIAFVIILMFFFGEVARDRLYGFQFHADYDRTFNIIPYIIKSIVLFAFWTVGNWSVCTLLDGEGTFKNICIYSAYALVPYVFQIYMNVILSHILVRDEYIFMRVIEISGIVWSSMLLFSAVKAVHQYSLKKTFTAVFLTLVMMLIMLVLIILFMVLIQQIWIFVSTVFTEIIYRLRV